MKIDKHFLYLLNSINNFTGITPQEQFRGMTVNEILDKLSNKPTALTSEEYLIQKSLEWQKQIKEEDLSGLSKDEIEQIQDLTARAGLFLQHILPGGY